MPARIGPEGGTQVRGSPSAPVQQSIWRSPCRASMRCRAAALRPRQSGRRGWGRCAVHGRGGGPSLHQRVLADGNAHRGGLPIPPGATASVASGFSGDPIRLPDPPEERSSIPQVIEVQSPHRSWVTTREVEPYQGGFSFQVEATPT